MIEHIKHDNGYPFKIVDIFDLDQKGIKKHRHLDIEIVIPIYNICLCQTDKLEAIYPGRIKIISSFLSHSFYPFFPNDYYKGYAIQLDYQLLKQYIPSIDDIKWKHLYTSQESKIRYLCIELIKNYQSNDLLKEIKIREIYYQLIHYLFEHCIIKTESNKNKPIIMRIIDYLENHFHESINLNKLEKELYLSKSYMQKVFKQETGITIKKYINELRIEESERLIRYTNKSITEIAYECGFQSTRTFYRQFELFKHISPLELRKKALLTRL